MNSVLCFSTPASHPICNPKAVELKSDYETGRMFLPAISLWGCLFPPPLQHASSSVEVAWYQRYLCQVIFYVELMQPAGTLWTPHTHTMRSLGFELLTTIHFQLYLIPPHYRTVPTQQVVPLTVKCLVHFQQAFEMPCWVICITDFKDFVCTLNTPCRQTNLHCFHASCIFFSVWFSCKSQYIFLYSH